MTFIWCIATIICVTTTYGYTLQTYNSTNKKTLVLLHVLIRHGARTPDEYEVYPKDPNAKFIKEFGQLTNKGKYHEYAIGQYLNRMYETFLGKYTSNTTLATTTDMDRTKMSSDLVMASLFPPTQDQRWNIFLNWQPIPYHYTIYQRDYLLGHPLINCPKFIQLYNEYMNTPPVISLTIKNQDLYNYLSNNTGWIIQNQTGVYMLYTNFESEEAMGYKLPKWSESVWPKSIADVAVEQYYINTATTELRKLAGGKFLQKIVNTTQQHIDGKLPENRKIFLYSAHEYNIAHFMILLDIFDSHIPPYSSHIIIEVHKVKDVFGLVIYYQDHTTRNPKLMKIPDCDTFCPFVKFRDIVKKYFPTSDYSCEI